MKPMLLAALSGVVTLSSGTAHAVDTSALLACRTLAADAERLACYDKLLDGQSESIGKGKATATTATTPTVLTVSAPVATAADTSGVVAVAASSQSAKPPREKQTSEAFGLERQIARETELDAIVSRIAGEFRGWEPSSRITLENGQVWQIADKSRGVYLLVDPVVTIERGALGTFNMRIEGANRSPKVKRLK